MYIYVINIVKIIKNKSKSIEHLEPTKITENTFEKETSEALQMLLVRLLVDLLQKLLLLLTQRLHWPHFSSLKALLKLSLRLRHLLPQVSNGHMHGHLFEALGRGHSKLHAS